MLIVEINGVPASTHIAARLFTDEGFAATAMGLQARTERLRPRGFAPAGIDIAEAADGGAIMANPTPRNAPEPKRDNNADMEHDRIRSSNDRDQQVEREGLGPPWHREPRGLAGEPQADVGTRRDRCGGDRERLVAALRVLGPTGHLHDKSARHSSTLE